MLIIGGGWQAFEQHTRYAIADGGIGDFGLHDFDKDVDQVMRLGRGFSADLLLGLAIQRFSLPEIKRAQTGRA